MRTILFLPLKARQQSILKINILRNLDCLKMMVDRRVLWASPAEVLSLFSYGMCQVGPRNITLSKTFEIAKMLHCKNANFSIKLTSCFRFDCTCLFLSCRNYKKYHIEAENVSKTY